MSARTNLFARLRRANGGAVTVEFALLAGIMITMLLGVLQVGLGMQAYNAMRNVSADTARYAMVQYETGNNLSNSQIRSYTISTARSAPYLLQVANFDASVSDAATQRVAGAKELTLTIEYQIPSVMRIIDLAMPRISYTRPIFLLEPAP